MTDELRRLNARKSLVALLALAAAMLCPGPARSQSQQPIVKLQSEPAQQSNEVTGVRLFHSYCAVCHGEDGKGHGVAAPALRTPPADLTTLTARNRGRFPANRVMDVLNGGRDFTAHGSKEMPVWGPVFRSMGANPSLGLLRVKNVTEYLRMIQEK